jgi:hypothetical protein
MGNKKIIKKDKREEMITLKIRNKEEYIFMKMISWW